MACPQGTSTSYQPHFKVRPIPFSKVPEPRLLGSSTGLAPGLEQGEIARRHHLGWRLFQAVHGVQGGCDLFGATELLFQSLGVPGFCGNALLGRDLFEVVAQGDDIGGFDDLHGAASPAVEYWINIQFLLQMRMQDEPSEAFPWSTLSPPRSWLQSPRRISVCSKHASFHKP